MITFAEDEHPRRSAILESLAGLKLLHPEIDGFSITAGNSSGANDAAAVVALAVRHSGGRAGEHPVVERGRRESQPPPLQWTRSPRFPRRSLELAGRKLADVALFEINEAFAAQAVACTRELGLDEEIVNVYGSGISLGHPIAATAREWSPPRSTNCVGAAAVSAYCRCARAVAWVPRWSSRWSEMTTPHCTR